MIKGKKFIAPGAWFSMYYPADWTEADGGEDSFLFYNPDRWTGNFRISAFRGGRDDYGEHTVMEELRRNAGVRPVKIGTLTCAYAVETFLEDGQEYDNHQWTAGIGDVGFEISFAVERGAPVQPALDIIGTLELRQPDVKYTPEVIPVRLMEIYRIDDAYDNVQRLIKQQLTKDVRGDESDVPNLQALADGGTLNPHKRDAWIDMGIALCVIATNVAEGYEWRTLIDGSREDPVLLCEADGRVIDPLKLLWSHVKAGEKADVEAAYDSIFG